MEGANKKHKKHHFTKNLSPPLFFEESSNFHNKSIIKFKKIECRKIFILKNITFIKKKLPIFCVLFQTFIFNIFKITTYKVFLTIKGTFPESFRSLAQKKGKDRFLVIF